MAAIVIDIPELDIPAAGTRVQVSTSDIPITSIVFQADPANTSYIYVGGSAVSSTRGKAIAPGGAYSINGDETIRGVDELILSDFWVDTATSGNDVWISYMKRR